MMNKRMFIFLVLVFSLMMGVQIGGAAVTGSSTLIYAFDTGSITDVEMVEHLNQYLIENPEFGTLSDFIDNSTSGELLFHKRLLMGSNSSISYTNHIIKINDTMYVPGGAHAFESYYSEVGYDGSVTFVDNARIIGWNVSNGTASTVEHGATPGVMKGIAFKNVDFGNNISFENLQSIELFDDSESIIDASLSNVYKGLVISNISDISIVSLDVHNCAYNGLGISDGSHDITISNYSFNNDEYPYRWTSGVYSSGATGSNGVSVGSGSHDIVLNNIYVNSSRWGGLYFSSLPYNISVTNLTANWVAHNGLDVHSGYNITVNGLSVTQAKANSIIVSSTDDYVQDILIKNIYSFNSSSHAINIGSNVNDVWFENLIIIDNGIGANGISIFDSDNVTFLNGTITGDGSGTGDGVKVSSGTTNFTLIDCNSTGHGYKEYDTYGGSNLYVFNCYLPTTRTVVDPIYGYYADIRVTDGTNPLENADISISGTNDSYNGLGYVLSSLTSLSDGHSPLPAQRPLTSILRDDTTYSITASLLNPTTTFYSNGTSSGTSTIYDTGNAESVTVNSSWYRDDLSTPPHTVDVQVGAGTVARVGGTA